MNSACGLCGAEDSEPLFESPVSEEAPGAYAATTDRFGAYGSVRRCRRCGLAFTSPRLPPERLLELYRTVEDEDYLLEGDARSMNAYLCLAVIRRFAQGGRLLDVGCATGIFLNAARLTYEATGVEPSAWARRVAEEKLKVAVAAATLEEARFPDAHFDVVTLIDVLEHVDDPSAVLREAARVTRPGGLAYLVTPDIGSLSARLLGRRWWGLRPAHLTYFSRKTLRAMLEKQGWEVLFERSYGRIFTWRYWLSRLASYPAAVRAPLSAFIRALGIEDKFLYLDTRDSVQVVARRRP